MTELNQILNALPWPAFIVGPDLRVGKFNSAAQSMFGLIGSDVPLVNVIRHPSVLKAVETSITTQIDHQALYLRRQIEGETAFKVHIRPVHPETGVMVCFENVDAAELLEQQRRDFVANVSHELRSPLTAIMGLLETLRGPALSDPKAQEQFFGIMANEANRMNVLIRDLLALSQVEHVQRQRPTTKINIDTVIKQACASVDQAMQTKGAEFTYRLSDAMLPLQGDHTQLVQVFVNLLENAVAYGASTSGHSILLSADVLDYDPQFQCPALRVVVSDHGPGIPAHLVPRLTERFFRVDSHRARNSGGTGLGLAIVKHIVQRHHGRLDVRSVEGEGTSFSVVLPY